MAAIRVRNAFLREWIDGATIQGDCDNENGTAAVEAGFAWNLYDYSLKLLSIIIPLNGSRASKKDARCLKELLGKLFLWGDGFGDGRLESVLDESDDLKESVMSQLTGIGNTLISSESYPRISKVRLLTVFRASATLPGGCASFNPR